MWTNSHSHACRQTQRFIITDLNQNPIRNIFGSCTHGFSMRWLQFAQLEAGRRVMISLREVWCSPAEAHWVAMPMASMTHVHVMAIVLMLVWRLLGIVAEVLRPPGKTNRILSHHFSAISERCSQQKGVQLSFNHWSLGGQCTTILCSHTQWYWRANALSYMKDDRALTPQSSPEPDRDHVPGYLTSSYRRLW